MSETKIEKIEASSKVFDGHPKHLSTMQDRLMHMKAAYEDGVLAALYDAVQYFRDCGGVPEEWVLDGVLKVVAVRLKEGKAISKGGPGGNDVSRFYFSRLHFRRWQVVNAMMDTSSSPTAAFKNACEYMKEHGEVPVVWQAVRNSYNKVEADWKVPERRRKYYYPMFEKEGRANDPV